MPHLLKFRDDEGQPQMWNEWVNAGLASRSGTRYSDRVFELIRLDIECNDSTYRGVVELDDELRSRTGSGLSDLLDDNLDDVVDLLDDNDQ